MPRRPGSHAVYEAAREWWDLCVLGRSSMLSLAQWTEENISALRGALASKPATPGSSFLENLDRQLDGESIKIRRLAGEALWVLLLFSNTTGPARKRDLIRTAIGDSVGQRHLANPMMSDAVLAGIGHEGVALNTYRYLEMDALLQGVQAIRRQGDQRAHQDVWEIGTWLDQVIAKRNIRNLLLHLVFPDLFEPVASVSSKREILKALPHLLTDYPRETTRYSDNVEVDRRLLHIRQRLALQYGPIFDFYDPGIREWWESAGPVPVHATAGVGLARAWDLAEVLDRGAPDPVLILAAFLRSSEEDSPESLAARALHDVFTRRDLDPLAVLVPSRPAELLRERPGRGAEFRREGHVERLVTQATDLSRRVALAKPRYVGGRHVLGVLLGHGQAPEIDEALRRFGLELADLRHALLEYVQGRTDERPDEWHALLFPRLRERGVAPGVSPDGPAAEDLLGLDREVDALAAILAASDTQPPISVGLFGDWGTGKSTFMKLLQAEIGRRAERAEIARAQGRPSAFCASVVTIEFNAWHYMDANLWASLAARVFQGLSGRVDHQKEPRSSTERAELEGSIRTAIREREAAQDELNRRKEERAGAGKHLGAAVLLQAYRDVVGVLSVEHPAREASAALGIELPQFNGRTDGTADGPTSGARVVSTPAEREKRERLAEEARQAKALEIERTAAEMRRLESWFQRGKVAFRKRVTWLLILVASGLFAGGTWILLRNLPGWNAAWSAIGAVAGALLALRGVVRTSVLPHLRTLHDYWSRLEATRDALQDAEIKRREAALASAEERVQLLQQEVEDLCAGRRMQRFIAERHGSTEYRGQTGIVNVVRADFERLSDLLADNASASRNGAWQDGDPRPVERIILYIDDLDRCPESRVVEVLQAVHLLLAFPLFVVVVGVDARWLMRSLEDHYSMLRGGAKTDESDAHRSTTPQHYLEKIFQIPFHLRPMREDGFGKLIDALLPSASAEPSREPSPATTPGTATPPAPSAGETSAETQPAPPAPEASESRESSDTAPDGAAEEAPDDLALLLPRPVDVGNDDDEPMALHVEPWEREFLRKLHPLIGSPRAVKRFTNLYRFLRALQAGEDLVRFRGTAEAPGAFQLAALLLGAQAGFALAAEPFFRRLQAANPDDEWWAFVEAERDTAGPHLRPLCEALLAVRPAVQRSAPKVRELRPWLPLVTRFSFGTGRMPV